MASRDFINVRMNPWYNEVNHNRELRLLGSFGDLSNTQNTVFCLFAPDAPGMAVDEFPDEHAVYFGTRAGRRRMFLQGTEALGDEELRVFLRHLRSLDTPLRPEDEILVERNMNEYRRVKDGDGVAEVMRELAAKYPAKPGSENEIPLLPVMPDLTQAINIASADTRSVIVVIHPETGGKELEDRLAPLVFEEGIAGRAHCARLTEEQWAEARQIRQVVGGSDGPGFAVLVPDPFGLEAEVWHQIPADVTSDELLAELREVMDRFVAEYRKPDRGTHLLEGAKERICWSEFNPDLGGVAPIPINEEEYSALIGGSE